MSRISVSNNNYKMLLTFHEKFGRGFLVLHLAGVLALVSTGAVLDVEAALVAILDHLVLAAVLQLLLTTSTVSCRPRKAQKQTTRL